MPTAFQWVTFGIGTLGAILGIIQTVRQILASRVSLRVKTYPLLILRDGDAFESVLCVEIINAGMFPVTIKEVCFAPKAYPKHRIIDSVKHCSDGSRLPKRIEAHDALQVHFLRLDSVSRLLDESKHVVVETACGKICFGSLKQWRRMTADAARQA